MDSSPRPVVVLTERQRRVLWLLSTGRTRTDICEETGESKGNINGALDQVFRLLKAKTAAQAVRNGLLLGHLGPYEDCGLLSAYRRHIKRDEPICPLCKRGNRERAEIEAARRNRPVRLTERQTMLLRAFAAGRTAHQTAADWGVTYRQVKRVTEGAYAALGVMHLPLSVRRERAVHEARVRGLLGVQPPSPLHSRAQQIHLSNTHVRILLELETGASFSAAAERLGMHPGTFSSRVSEAYKRLGVDWVDKPARREAALRKARALGLLPEPAAT
jgi:DNA-binding NarL/FixJ family response regulator